MAIQIRKAAISDLEDMCRLRRLLLEDQVSKDPYCKDNMHHGMERSALVSALNSTECSIFIASVEERAVGFIEVWLYDKDFHFFADDYVYILHYMVDPEYRQHKDLMSIVLGLFRAAEDWALSKGRRYVVTDIYDHNQRVVRLLEFVGLTPYRTRMAKEIQREKKSSDSGVKKEDAV